MKHDGYTVRWATPSDCALMASLELDSSRYEKRFQPIDLTLSDFSALWKERLNSREYAAILAFSDDKLCGFLSFRGEIRDGFIAALYVEPAFFRMKVGTLLVNVAEVMVRRLKGLSLRAEVQEHNDSAIHFYRSLHFVRTPVKLAHMIVMEKEFTNA
ncbi:MAG: GNAT family N-acetyltransferase [Succinivibrio sp.]|nr:GNAT family N-acetyltransferase [Succinivibrio sp.]